MQHIAIIIPKQTNNEHQFLLLKKLQNLSILPIGWSERAVQKYVEIGYGDVVAIELILVRD